MIGLDVGLAFAGAVLLACLIDYAMTRGAR